MKLLYTDSNRVLDLIFIGLLGFWIGYIIALLVVLSKPDMVSPLGEPKPAVFMPRAEAKPSSSEKPNNLITGKASYYNRGICELHGTVYGKDCLTKNGEMFDDRALISACPKSLLNKYITVTHNSKSIRVQCIDTGSFGEKYKRVLDLSQGAFEQLAPASKGVIDVSYSVEG